MWCNKEYIWSSCPVSGTEFQKSLGISWVKGVSFVMSYFNQTSVYPNNTFIRSGEPRQLQIRGWLPEKTTMWLGGWNFQTHSKTSGEVGVGLLEIKCNHMANDLINCVHLMKPLWNLGTSKLRGTSWLVNVSMYQEGGAPWLHRNRSSWAQNP